MIQIDKNECESVHNITSYVYIMFIYIRTDMRNG